MAGRGAGSLMPKAPRGLTECRDARIRYLRCCLGIYRGVPKSGA